LSHRRRESGGKSVGGEKLKRRIVDMGNLVVSRCNIHDENSTDR